MHDVEVVGAGPGVADTGTGAHYALPEAHGQACRRALDRDPHPAAVISLAGIPLHRAPCLPPGTVHVGERDGHGED